MLTRFFRHALWSALCSGMLLGASGPALAAPPPPAADPCAQAENTIGLQACNQRVLKARDQALNAAWQALMKTLTPSSADDRTDYAAVRRELTEAQRAWVRFRDADCSALYKYWEDGSIRGIKHLNCLIDHTETRTRQLLDWAAV